MTQKIQSALKNHYKIIRKISQGDFGQIFQAIQIKTNLQVAIKVSPANTKNSHQISNEWDVYSHFQNDKTVIDKGVPFFYDALTDEEYNFLIIDLMGPSLENLFKHSLGSFSLKTVLMLMDQMISRVQYIHNMGIIHRNLKPTYFCMGLNKTSHKIFLINFGLAKHQSQRHGKHQAYREGEYPIGRTVRYSSIKTDSGFKQSFRDDMQSIGYIAMQLLRGKLPWQSLETHSSSERLKLIIKKKQTTSIEELCKGYPPEFASYLTRCRNLKFDERPPYEAFRAMFKELFNAKGYKFDYQYDWVILQNKRQQFQKKQLKAKQQI